MLSHVQKRSQEIGEDMSYGSALVTTKLLQCHVLEFYLLIFLQGQQLLVAGPGCGAKDAKDSNGQRQSERTWHILSARVLCERSSWRKPKWSLSNGPSWGQETQGWTEAVLQWEQWFHGQHQGGWYWWSTTDIAARPQSTSDDSVTICTPW